MGGGWGAGPWEEGVISSGSGVPILSRHTFKDFFEEGVPPFIFSAPGGLYVKLDGEALRRAREGQAVSPRAPPGGAGGSPRAAPIYPHRVSSTDRPATPPRGGLRRTPAPPA